MPHAAILSRAVLFARRSLRQFHPGLLACALIAGAHAQTNLTLPPFTPIVTVSPVVADVGVARTITVSASWPDGCVPVSPSLSPSTLPSSDTLNIRFSLPMTLIACTQVVTPYSATFTYTPTKAGAQRIAVMLTDGRYLGGGQLITQGAGQPRASVDLTGVWYDPASNGSGFSLFHSQSGSDVMAGAWYVYDGTGKPFWYLMQNGRWQSNTTYLANLIELQGATTGCAILLPACARPQQSTRIVANISIQVLSLDRIRVTVTPHGEVVPAVVLADFEAVRLRF
ncbi:MAG: hypothetical protein JNM76_00845 [Betaproteobacteria bacterium]|nr:hypothetical protein [Betaproteobacteria bacterium]